MVCAVSHARTHPSQTCCFRSARRAARRLCRNAVTYRNPSHLISKSQSGCENGARARDSGMAWKRGSGTNQYSSLGDGHICRPELRHNNRACAPSRTTPRSRPLFWIASLRMRKALARRAPASGARCAAGLPARATSGGVLAAMSGTRSTREACVRHASSGGLRPNAFHAPAGQHTLIGMRSDALTNGSKPRTAARAETTGYAPASRHSFDSQPRGRSGLAVWHPAPRRYAPATRFRQ